MEGCRGNNRAGVVVFCQIRTKTEPKATNHRYNYSSTLLLLGYFKTTNMVPLKQQLLSGLIQLILLLLLLKAPLCSTLEKDMDGVFCLYSVFILSILLQVL